ncbi:MAG: glycosyltransferase [Balneolaceae bacterium]|nr:glycosyltransferase [Balneolaceae bacterium]
MHYSIIIPVYNRPDEIGELLESLTKQTYKNFEVLIIEDGSEITCKNVVDSYAETLNIRYIYKENSGQGFSRNYGFERAKGEYFVVFDSDCIIPPHYFEHVSRQLEITKADCWGGPDKALPSFTAVQKAINYSMTSFFTTGGMRGGSRKSEGFHPRSFNMGISRQVFEKTGGYKITRMGEDIEFSIRIIKHGFKTVLMKSAFVYHKRRTGLKQFYSQLHFFGRARINITRFYPDELKLIHFFPVIFFIGYLIILPLFIAAPAVAGSLFLIYFAYTLLLFVHSLQTEKKIDVAFLAVAAAYIQFTAYGIGFLSELMNESST